MFVAQSLPQDNDRAEYTRSFIASDHVQNHYPEVKTKRQTLGYLFHVCEIFLIIKMILCKYFGSAVLSSQPANVCTTYYETLAGNQ